MNEELKAVKEELESKIEMLSAGIDFMAKKNMGNGFELGLLEGFKKALEVVNGTNIIYTDSLKN